MLRLLRKESLQPALSGLLGAAVAAVIAYQTGNAKDFFLLGIWVSLALAAVFLISVVVRWLLVGVIWNLVNGAGHSWRCLPPGSLSSNGFTTRTPPGGWRSRRSMGYPLAAMALLVAVWAVRRSAKRLNP